MITPQSDEYCYDLTNIDLKGLQLVVNDDECFLEIKEHFFPITSTTDFRKLNKNYVINNGFYELSIPEEQFQLIKELLPF